MTEKEQRLRELYYNPETGLTSAVKLWHRVKSEGYTLREVKEFVGKQEIQQVFNKKVKNFNAIVGGDNDYQMDLMFFPQYKKLNEGHDTIMNVINITSRKAYAVAMKGKSQAEVNRAFDLVMKEIPEAKNITSDNEASFKSTVKRYPELKHWLADVGDKTKVGMIERFNRTLRDMLTKYMKLNKTKTWYRVLSKMMQNYNTSVHSTIGIAPNDFNKEDGRRIRDEAYARGYKAKQEAKELKVGDTVRILKKKKNFQKGGESYSKQTYIIASKGPISMRIRSTKNNQLLLNRYKAWELARVDHVEAGPVQKEEQTHSSKAIRRENKFDKAQKRDDIPETVGNKRLQPTSNTRAKTPPLVGKRVKIFWKGENKWFQGTVMKRDGQKFLVEYDDGDKEWETYKPEKWKIL